MRYGIALLIVISLTATLFSEEIPEPPKQQGANMTETASGKTQDVLVTRIFEAPVERVWKAWSDSEEVMKWWGPKVFTSPVAKIDFREGGKSLVCMRSPDGHDMYNTWTYQKIVPNQRIEYIFNFSDKDGNKLDPAQIGMPPGIPKDGHHVVTFKDLGNGKTEMTMVEHGYTSSEVVELSKAGLNECLDKMAESFKTP
jgi:uncharacterized protein YndB with AHSA1/START domain